MGSPLADPYTDPILMGLFVNGMVIEWNRTIYGIHFILKKLFLKLISIFLFFTSNQSFFIIF